MSVARIPAVARALRATFATDVVDAETRLTGGLSGAGSWRIRVGGIPYALRVDPARDAVRDPARAQACQKIAADALLSPRLRHADPESGVTIVEWIEAQPLSDFPGGGPALLDELARTVRLLHETPAFPPLTDYVDALDGLVQSLLARPLLPAGTRDRTAALWSCLSAASRAAGVEPVSSHNDLNPRNILSDGRRLWLVDWEAAFLTDRYVDLAAIANLFAPSPQAADRLLAVYFGAPPTDRQRARLALARRVSHLFYAVMFLTLAAGERPDARLSEGQACWPLAHLHAALGEGELLLETWEGRLEYGLARLDAAA
ncbi:phosphotransferase [Caulobacter endophyticus]|uniref:phosphotransferase n=1 Tax=Caulobacter endophyticus TaxID=2172652 RepID=UPI00241013AF|nr:phosphotransferase [Caulobacter endophyticus]MDG2527636.1 phosphotransferase [Caulobacter endophyticus]